MRESQLTNQEKKYIEVQYSPVSQGYLREYCSQNDLDLSVKFDKSTQDPEDFDFHTTVWFTTSEHSLPNSTSTINIDDIEPVGFELFGEDENILVLEIKSEKLEEVRKEFGDKYHMQDQWPAYRPHITLSYSFTGPLPEIEFPNCDEVIADTLNIKTQTVIPK